MKEQVVKEWIERRNKMIRCDQQRITERIWLSAFSAPPKFPFGELQIPARRYLQLLI